MTFKGIKWQIDKFADPGYNRVCEFEIVLLNLGIVIEDYQWDIETIEVYSTKHKEVSCESKKYCKETGGIIYGDSEFEERLNNLVNGTKPVKVRFTTDK